MKTSETVGTFDLLKKSMNSIPFYFIIIDAKNFTIVTVNKQMALSLGKNEDELIGKNILDLFSPKTAKIRKKFVELGIKTKKPQFFEDERNGRWFSNQFYPLLDDMGNVTHGLIFVDEITKRRKMESEFKDINREFRILAEYMTDLVFQITLTGKFTYVNPVSIRYGYKPEEMMGKNFSKFVAKKELPRYFSQIRKMISGEKIDNFESTVIHKEGYKIPAEFSGQMVKIGNKRFINGIMRNISERKKTEKKIKDEKERAETYLNLAGTIILALDPNGNIQLLNRKGYEILGYHQGDLLGKNWFETCIPDEFVDEVKNVFDKCMDGEIEFTDHFENPVIKKDGKSRIIDWYNTIIRDHKGKIIGTLSSGEDITERKKAEKQMKESREYLQKIIDNTSELIFTINQDFKIKLWNKTAEQITGYGMKDVVGGSINKIDLFCYPNDVHEIIDDIKNKKTSANNEIVINTKYGIKKIFSVSPSFILDEISGNVIETLFVCSDITHEKDIHDSLKDGYSYIIEDSLLDIALDIFKDMMKMKYKGLFIGREKKEQIKKIFNKKSPHTIRFSSEKDEEYPTITTPEELYQQIKDFLHKNNQTVILIDRLDYLITNNSFEPVMKTLYKINDLIEKNKSVLLLNINISYLNNNQTALIRQEIEGIPKIQVSDIIINEELIDIISYIYGENKRNVYVNYGKISKKFSLSKVTTKKRIETLVDKGLIISKKRGKTKILFLTNKGNKIVERVTII